MLSIPKRPLHTCTVLILWDKNFYWDINFAILLMADFLNSNFRNLSMIQLKFKNQNLLIFNSVNSTNLSQVAKLNFMLYIFILQGVFFYDVQRCINLTGLYLGLGDSRCRQKRWIGLNLHDIYMYQWARLWVNIAVQFFRMDTQNVGYSFAHILSDPLLIMSNCTCMLCHVLYDFNPSFFFTAIFLVNNCLQTISQKHAETPKLLNQLSFELYLYLNTSA